MLLTLLAILILVGAGAAISSLPSPDYPDLSHTVSPERLDRMQQEHEEEVAEFLAKTKGRDMSQWSLGEQAQYESIRRREAQFGL